MPELAELTEVVNQRFDAYLAMLGGAPRHRVEFSRRITTSWALIYYRRRLVRLSPYLFLLEPEQLKHGTHWRELDATLRHEAAHACHFDRTGEPGHTEGFHLLLQRLGVKANGACDLGPENEAFRYVYACPSCDNRWSRRAPLKGNYSCGVCAPGGYHAEHKLLLVEQRDPWTKMKDRRHHVRLALEEARRTWPAAPHARAVAPADHQPQRPVVSPVIIG